MNTTKSRILPKKFDDNTSDCICERPQTNLICMNCTRRLFGRVHKVCQKHPTLVYLYDHATCPCGGRLIESITEIKAGFH